MAREAVQAYLSAVGARIRWRRARRPLLEELAAHIDDQAADYRAQGMGEEEALERAVAEMGDPEAVGRDLDRLHRPKNRWGLALAVLLLALAGPFLQFMIYQVTGQGVFDVYARQAVWVPIALALLCGVWFSDCTLLLRRRWAAGLTVAAVAWAVLNTNGTYRPIALYVTLLLPVLYAALLCRRRDGRPVAVLLWGLAAWVLPLPTMLVPSASAYLLSGSSMTLVLLTAAGLGWFAGKRRKNILLSLLPTLLGLGVLFLSGLQKGYFLRRLSGFLHPELDPNGIGYLYLHLRQGTLADLRDNVLSSTDLMLAFLAQWKGEWVFPFSAVLLALAALLLLRRVWKLRSRTGKLLALSALLPLLLQVGLYILYNLGYSLFAPLSLPFLSYGAGYLLLNCILVGFLLSVFRMDALLRDGASGPAGPILPERLELALAGGRLRIEYRRRRE
ncbi:permease prefix domain 1-containing protein [uncultured Intestinimonas sp.]|uniref:permease prefix domain 1-containing protein n=1 Tax=uncultured Intestinimonas sp. TaxID=1689265 RepID=UPI0025FFB672|nr:permease prefix domain 1-containing protein [uncultured Intestinimonas sp.]